MSTTIGYCKIRLISFSIIRFSALLVFYFNVAINMRSVSVSSSFLMHQTQRFYSNKNLFLGENRLLLRRNICGLTQNAPSPWANRFRMNNQRNDRRQDRYSWIPSSLMTTTSSSSSSSSTSNTSSNNSVSSSSKELHREMVAQTPLFKDASHLLNGLDTYIVEAEDGHPISLYGIHSISNYNGKDSSLDANENVKANSKRRPILMLHGRTWSSVPVYHLLGGNQYDRGISHHSRSLMEALYDAGLQPYCMDFRGFGGTPKDATNYVIPNRCVMDIECVLKFIGDKHNVTLDNNYLPALMGWSQGALVAQLLAQKSPNMISKLILYGSIYDPLVSYPRQPLYVNNTADNHNNGGSVGSGGDDSDAGATQKVIENTFNGAIEDFTVEGSIPPAAAIEFAEAALSSDPIKAQWHYLCQFNNCDPARVHVPTLVVAGDQDPYAPLRVQSELFTNLGRGADRTWSIISDADHAVHLLDGGRERFLNVVKSFVDNGKKGGKATCM
jgi:Predicted hydrolases or acyltransferases (alpha/beta hydrolase superfamily)